MTNERPTINLAVHEDIGDEQLTQVFLSIEEEGVPSRVERLSELSPPTLAHRAATSPRLGIGLRTALDYAVITTEGLPERCPCLAYLLEHSEQVDRIIESNAARLVKRLPLRESERNQ